MKKIIFAVLICVLCSFINLKPFDIKTVRLDKTKSSITYKMSHPMHSWEGVTKDVDGAVQFDDKTGKIVKVAVVAKISSFDSKSSNRDSHMLEVTEAIKYPTVSFVSTAIKDDGAVIDVTGNIIFHNVTKQVHFIAASATEAKNRTVTGNFIVMLEDFKLERPSLMMVKTDNEMKMSFSVVFSEN